MSADHGKSDTTAGQAGPQTAPVETAQSRSVSAWLRLFLRAIWHLPGGVLIALVKVYQWTLSPIVGRQCRFQPTCSNYFIGAVRKYGAVSGTLRGLWRICRCHPWHPGGCDPP